MQTGRDSKASLASWQRAPHLRAKSSRIGAIKVWCQKRHSWCCAGLVVLRGWHVMPPAMLLAVVLACLVCFSYFFSHGSYGSYSHGNDWHGSGIGCGLDYTSVTCDGGIVMLSIGCDDSTCGNCSMTMDYTAYTDGSYTCDDSCPPYYYDDGATKWYLPQPGWFCGGSPTDHSYSSIAGGADETRTAYALGSATATPLDKMTTAINATVFELAVDSIIDNATFSDDATCSGASFDWVLASIDMSVPLVITAAYGHSMQEVSAP